MNNQNQNAVEGVNEYAAGGKLEFCWDNLTTQEKREWVLFGAFSLSAMVILGVIMNVYGQPLLIIGMIAMYFIQRGAGANLKKTQQARRYASIGGSAK